MDRFRDHTPEQAERPRKERASAGMRSKTYVFKRLRDDLAMLKLRHRRGHDLRRTMILLARTDGARKDILESALPSLTMKK
jgi:hypothetical protein